MCNGYAIDRKTERAHYRSVETPIEPIVRILKGYGHAEAEAVDIARRILAVREPAQVQVLPVRRSVPSAA